MLFVNFDKEIGKKYCNVHELAMLLNVSPRKIQMLAKKGILPKEERGKYEMLPCLHAYLLYLKKMIYHFAGYYSGKHNLKFLLDNHCGKKGNKSKLALFDEIQQGVLPI